MSRGLGDVYKRQVLSLRGYIGAALMLLSLFIMEGDWSFLGRKKRA